MAYTPPQKTTFIGLFPAFVAVTDDQYAFWSAQAALVTGPMEGCLGARMDLATMLATAHYLTLAGVGTGTEAEMAAQGATGFRRIKSGTIELERADTSNDNDAGEWAATSYGLRVWPMLRACVGGPLVTATGSIGCGHSGYRSGPMPWQ